VIPYVPHATTNPIDRPEKIFLRPGEFFFGSGNVQVRTILGSCVAITVWHPGQRIGGMCHYMLPNPKRHRTGDLDGRYAEDAIDMFLKEIKRHKTTPQEYQVKVFGGGNMFPEAVRTSVTNIGGRNLQIGQDLLRQHNFRIMSSHLGGEGYRRILFDIGNGDVWVYHSVQEKKSIGNKQHGADTQN